MNDEDMQRLCEAGCEVVVTEPGPPRYRWQVSLQRGNQISLAEHVLLDAALLLCAGPLGLKHLVRREGKP